MKLLVDEMPAWRGDCPFAKGEQSYYYYIYTCTLTNTPCDIYEIDDGCRMLKPLKLKVNE